MTKLENSKYIGIAVHVFFSQSQPQTPTPNYPLNSNQNVFSRRNKNTSVNSGWMCLVPSVNKSWRTPWTNGARTTYPHNRVRLPGTQRHTRRCSPPLPLDGTEPSCHMCGSRRSKDSRWWGLNPLHESRGKKAHKPSLVVRKRMAQTGVGLLGMDRILSCLGDPPGLDYLSCSFEFQNDFLLPTPQTTNLFSLTVGLCPGNKNIPIHGIILF